MAAVQILRWFVGLLAILLSASFTLSDNDGLGTVVVTIVSQGDAYNSARAKEKRERWLEQLSVTDPVTEHQSELPVILLAHELPVSGAAWTIVPLLSYLAEHHGMAEWYFFVTEEAQVSFKRLKVILQRYNSKEVWFLGHALKDQKSTIIHHYMDHTSNETVHYPNFASGWALSRPALKGAMENVGKFTSNFNIDASFELAIFLKYMRTPELKELHPTIPSVAAESGGYTLTHVKELCMQNQLTSDCATAYSHNIHNCGSMEKSNIFFGVKTCEKFHSARLPVVQRTWAPDAEGSIAYYSEVEDTEFHTTDIGVPNTLRGHCGKMMAIINKFQSSEEFHDKEWLVIADDDTLLSISRLARLLACYSSHEAILLGEAYGFNAQYPWPAGYTYITGGGSMVLSHKAVEVIVSSGVRCPDDSTPDDMFLGRICEKYGIHIIHSPLFHQAQPDTFHPSILALQESVSFHRHRPKDPYTVYKDYLTDPSNHDNDTGTHPTSKHSTKKTEL